MKKLSGGSSLPTSRSALFRCLLDMLALQAEHVPEDVATAHARHVPLTYASLRRNGEGDSSPPE